MRETGHDSAEDLPVSAFDFELPEGLIALRPARPRSSARMLVAQGANTNDRIVSDLPNILRSEDLLIFNDTKVLPVQLTGQRHRGDNIASFEATLIERIAPDAWRAFAKPGKRLQIGDEVCFAETLTARVTAKNSDGTVDFAFPKLGSALDDCVREIGAMPLPPYIAGRRASDSQDFQDYQTLLAREEGAVAAPTAALHFDEALFKALDNAGIGYATVTLHVGAGTFLPVKAESLSAHVMHSETGSINEATAERIAEARRKGGRVIAVGTTSLRVLETATDASGTIRPWTGKTDIFISPGYKFRCIDGLMTNFHLPRSTLFMLVSALMGLNRMQAIYQYAIRSEYRFYSYGDSSLLMPESTLL